MSYENSEVSTLRAELIKHAKALGLVHDKCLQNQNNPEQSVFKKFELRKREATVVRQSLHDKLIQLGFKIDSSFKNSEGWHRNYERSDRKCWVQLEKFGDSTYVGFFVR